MLKREMVMAARDLQKRKEIWSWKASQEGCTAGMIAYASKKSDFFSKLSEELLEECGEHIEVCVIITMRGSYLVNHFSKDPIVHFEWSEKWYKEHRKGE